jgi:hypothetical protein
MTGGTDMIINSIIRNSDKKNSLVLALPSSSNPGDGLCDTAVSAKGKDSALIKGRKKAALCTTGTGGVDWLEAVLFLSEQNCTRL